MPTESPAKPSIYSDLLYILTFSLGMGAFWISVHAASALSHAINVRSSFVMSLLVTAVVYGVVMLMLALLIVKRLIPALAATGISIILGLVAAQVIIRLSLGHINTKQDLGFLTFGLYLCYGGIYVLALVIARKIANSRVKEA